MHESFWHQRWAEGRTGWHQSEVDRLLQKHWPSLDLPPRTSVLVPLCGKSLDLGWLADRGHHVTGVELSRPACEAFFAERGVTPSTHERAGYTVFDADGIELWCGDALTLPATLLSAQSSVYDRAALIALPPDMRGAYVEAVYRPLARGTRALLITLEYPEEERAGPPFAVPEPEVRALFEPDWQVECLERRDILDHEPRFREEGVSAMHTAVYRLQRT